MKQQGCQLNNKQLTFIDLFAGIGGFRLACENLGLKCVFSSEIDHYACLVYEKNFKSYPLFDIYDVNTKDIDDFDILLAGFPCQSFSTCGKRDGFKGTGILFYEVLRFLKEKRPKAFLLENVKGLTNHEQGKTLETILDAFKCAGYKTYQTILNSRDFGLAQSRERWFCVGFKEDLPFTFPRPNCKKVLIKEILNKEDDFNQELKLKKKWIKRINKHIKSNSKIVQHFDFFGRARRYKGGVFSKLHPVTKKLTFHGGKAYLTSLLFLFLKSLFQTQL